MKEMTALTKTPPEGMKFHFNEDDICDIQCDIQGPATTPFEGGVFRMKLCIGSDFPQVPPKGVFTVWLVRRPPGLT